MEYICDNCEKYPCTDDDYKMRFTCPGFSEKQKPITNADRVRAMSDEELAAWIERIRLCCSTDLCGRSCPLSEVCYSNAETPTETLDWLRQEGK